ncbi:hypothetical protein ACFWB2_12655 [Streptomyces virginiae]|uniref:hypothetical protein n=1 Tax=Streptomyces virginiae TaxID=1961 RepID=UPI0036A5B005
MEQADGVHGRHAVQVDQEVAFIGGDAVQGPEERPARVLVEFAVGADQDRVAAALDAHLDQVLLPSPAGTDPGASIVARPFPRDG